MKGLSQLLTFLNENWTFIIIIIGAGIALYKKIKNYLTLSDEEKIDAALTIIRNTIKAKMTSSQIDWYGIKDAGSVKRAEVISKIYEDYPVLKNYVNQEELLKKIDDIIDEALEEVKKIAENCVNNQISLEDHDDNWKSPETVVMEKTESEETINESESISE